MPLVQVGSGFQFASEQTLETFVWSNLEAIFNLKPLRQQYGCRGEYCDILAIRENGQLVILELKNAEDRYVVQQLTRYYDNLVEEQALAAEIDYSQPVELIAIAPSFHRHNLIDCKYSILRIELFTFTVQQEAERFYLHLVKLDGTDSIRHPIPYQMPQTTTAYADLPDPPTVFLSSLGSCSDLERQVLLNLRGRILSFHPQMEEIIIGRSVCYGKGKQFCAELCLDRNSNRPALFLWLPLPTPKREMRGRIRLWIEGERAAYAGHIPEGLGKMRLEPEWQAIPKAKWPRQALRQGFSKDCLIPFPAEAFLGWLNFRGKTEDKKPDDLETLVDFALKVWLQKV